MERAIVDQKLDSAAMEIRSRVGKASATTAEILAQADTVDSADLDWPAPLAAAGPVVQHRRFHLSFNPTDQGFQYTECVRAQGNTPAATVSLRYG